MHYTCTWCFAPGAKESLTHEMEFLEYGARLTGSMWIRSIDGSQVDFRITFEGSSMDGSFPSRRGEFSRAYSPPAEAEDA